MRSEIFCASESTVGLSGSDAAGPGWSGSVGTHCVKVSFSEKYSLAMMRWGSPAGLVVGMTFLAAISSSVSVPRMGFSSMFADMSSPFSKGRRDPSDAPAALKLLMGSYAVFQALTWSRSHWYHSSMPSPVLAQMGMTRALGLRMATLARHLSRSKSK